MTQRVFDGNVPNVDIPDYEPPSPHSELTDEANQERHITPPAERQNAFHAMGTEIPEGMDVEEALEYCHMANWNVRKIPHRQNIEVEDGQGGTRIAEVAIPNMYTVLRDSPFTGEPEALGAVGRKWTPFQNESVANLCRRLRDMGGVKPAAYGVLGGGRKTFLAMKFPEGLQFHSPHSGLVDTTDLYLTVFNSHDGFGSLSANITPVRPYCANQQRMAESLAKTRFLLRHTGEEQIRMQQLEELLGESFEYHQVYREMCQAQIEKELDEDEVLRELNKLFLATDPDLTERQRELRADVVGQVRYLYNHSETVEPFRGTAYGLYNAITEYTDHSMRVIVPDGQNEREVRALRTLQSEDVDSLKQRAFLQLLPADARVAA